MTNLSYMPLPDGDDKYEDSAAPNFDGMSMGQGEQAFDLGQVMHTLWRRKMIIIATSFIMTVLAIFGVMQATPLYVAEAELVVEQQRERLILRHLETWSEEKTKMFGSGREGAGRKADTNDVINARMVCEISRSRADRIITSIDEL